MTIFVGHWSRTQSLQQMYGTSETTEADLVIFGAACEGERKLSLKGALPLRGHP